MAGSNIKADLLAAESAAKSGDTARAVALYRGILTKAPKHTKAKKALTRLQKQGGATGAKMTQADAQQLVVVLNSGNIEGARHLASQMAQAFPNEPFVFNILGYTSGLLGDDKTALSAYKWAIKLNPNFVEALSNYGAYLMQTDRLNDAIAVLQKAVTKKANYAEAHHNLGAALAAANRTGEAMKHYNQAIKIDPNYANAISSRAGLKSSLGDGIGAYEDYTKVHELVPNDAMYLQKLAGVLATLGRSDEALSYVEKAIALDPKQVSPAMQKAMILKEAGRTQEAFVAFETLLALDPDKADAKRLMLDIIPSDKRSAFAKGLEKDFNKDGVTDADRVDLGFALGTYFEKEKNYEQSAYYLNIANSTYRASLPTPPETDSAKFARITRQMQDKAFAKLAGADATTTPIFVVGLMRSGTSLVEQIVSSHSQVFGAGELTAATEFSEEIYAKGKRATMVDAQNFTNAYLERLRFGSDDAPRCLDKMPANFFNVGLLKTLFPNAKFVNLMRDPRDNCFSIYKNFFDTFAHQYAYDQVELAAFANNYKRMMNLWDDLFPGAVYNVKYETLVADQEAESRRLLDYLELPWEDQVLEFHKNKRAVRTASVTQVRQKIYKSSVQSWKNYEEFLQPLITGLDHDLWKDALVD